jgi:hypothetical protein
MGASREALEMSAGYGKIDDTYARAKAGWPTQSGGGARASIGVAWLPTERRAQGFDELLRNVGDVRGSGG